MKKETVFPEISRPPYPSKIISMMPLHAPAFGTPCWNFPPWYNQLTAVDQCCHPRPAGLETLWSVGSFPCQWAQWLGLSLGLGSRHLSLKCSICSPDTTGYPASPKWTGKRKKEKLWLLHLWHFSSFSKKLYVVHIFPGDSKWTLSLWCLHTLLCLIVRFRLNLLFDSL